MYTIFFCLFFLVCDIRTTLSTAARPNQNQSYNSPSRILPFLLILILLSAIHLLYSNNSFFSLSLSLSIVSFIWNLCVRALYAVAASFSSTLFFIYIVRLTPAMSIRTMHNKHTLNETISCMIYNLKKEKKIIIIISGNNYVQYFLCVYACLFVNNRLLDADTYKTQKNFQRDILLYLKMI